MLVGLPQTDGYAHREGKYRRALVVVAGYTWSEVDDIVVRTRAGDKDLFLSGPAQKM